MNQKQKKKPSSDRSKPLPAGKDPSMAGSEDPRTRGGLQPSEPQPPLPKPPFKVNENSTGQRAHYPNPPETVNPDATALRDQWRYAIRQYSKWYSHAWGTAILAGGAFFALGWIIKGSNPLPSLSSAKKEDDNHSSSSQPPSGSQLKSQGVGR